MIWQIVEITFCIVQAFDVQDIVLLPSKSCVNKSTPASTTQPEDAT